MDYSLVVRHRLTESENLASRSLSRRIRRMSEAEEPLAAQKVIVRFQPYEVSLLQTIVDNYASEEEVEGIWLERIDKTFIHLLYRWSWGFDVLRQLFADLDPVEVDEGHGGSKREAFEMVTTLLGGKPNDQCDDKRFERVRQWVADNRELYDSLDSLDVSKIELFPHPHDVPLWRGLAVLFLSNLDEMSDWKGFRHVHEFLRPYESIDAHSDNEEVRLTCETSVPGSETLIADGIDRSVDGLIDLEDTWDVWKFCRMFRLLKVNPANAVRLGNFTSDSSFTVHWKDMNIKISDEEDQGVYHGFFRRKPFDGQYLSSVIEFFEHTALEDLTLHYHERIHNHALEEPSRYLEHIPWEELTEPQSLESIHDFLEQLDLQLDSVPDSYFRLWRCDQTERYCRGFFTDEEIYAHQILQSFEFPGFCHEEYIILRSLPLKDSTFCQELDKFWPEWNDCAITRRAADGEIFLLETLPGLKFRQLRKRWGFDAAHAFFSSVLRQSLRGTPQNVAQELLGSNHQPSYAYFLDYIDPAEFRDLSTRPIGQGGYGKVFRATWIRMPALEFGLQETKCGDVAIKMAWQRQSDSSADREKFFRELRIVHTASAGGGWPLLKFLGFSKCFTDDEGGIYLNSSRNLTEVFVLVFEYATEGTIIDFLTSHLKDGQSTVNWEILCEALGGIAEGINKIHSRDIVHRDIHPNNVLMQKKYFANSDSIQYSSRLADLGEGKKIHESDSITQSQLSPRIRNIGLRRYEASEIRSSTGYSKASDIYAFGQLGVDMIRLNYSKFQEMEGIEAELPAKLVHILENCKDEEPSERYEATLVASMLVEVCDNLRKEKTEWTTVSELPIQIEEDVEPSRTMWSVT